VTFSVLTFGGLSVRTGEPAGVAFGVLAFGAFGISTAEPAVVPFGVVTFGSLGVSSIQLRSIANTRLNSGNDSSTRPMFTSATACQ